MTQVAMPIAAGDRLLERFGPAAAAWIDDFGTIVGELCRKWGTGASLCLRGWHGRSRRVRVDRRRNAVRAQALT